MCKKEPTFKKETNKVHRLVSYSYRVNSLKTVWEPKQTSLQQQPEVTTSIFLLFQLNFKENFSICTQLCKSTARCTDTPTPLDGRTGLILLFLNHDSWRFLYEDYITAQNLSTTRSQWFNTWLYPAKNTIVVGKQKTHTKRVYQALRQGRKSRERWMAKRVDGGAEIKETRRGGGGEGSHNLITANTETQKHLLWDAVIQTLLLTPYA